MILALLSACTPDAVSLEPVETPLPSEVDCTTLPVFEQTAPFPAARANRSLLIDGPRLIGWDTRNLIVAYSPFEADILVPSITAYGNAVALGDGDLLVSEHLGNENVLRVTADGGVEVVAVGLRAYGMVEGPDGRIYATSEPDTIYRIDPVTWETTPWLVFPAGVLPRISDFSPEGDRLYVGTRNEDGTVWVIDVDEDVEPVGEPRIHAQTRGSFHDGFAVDACGDLYVTSYFGSDLAHITPAGEVTVLAELTSETHLHGLSFGSGEGAWQADTLYLAQPNIGNVVSAWPLGRPGRRTGPVPAP